MTIFANDPVWRTDVVPFANDGISWTELNKIFIYQNGGWVQYYGPGLGAFTKAIFSGGINTSTVAETISDLFSFETLTTAAQASANLTSGRTTAGVSNNIFGIFAGGNTAYRFNTTGVVMSDICPWGTLVTAEQASANLIDTLFGIGCISSLLNGLLVGGATDPNTAAITSNAELCQWATITTFAQSSAEISLARVFLGAAENKIYGLFVGGITAYGTNWAGPTINVADLTIIATYSTAAQSSANLSANRAIVGGTSDHMEFCLFMGGREGATSNTNVNTADLCLWETLVTSVRPSANLTQTGYFAVGCNDQINAVFTGWSAASGSGFTSSYQGPSGNSNICPWATLTCAYNEFANLSTNRMAAAAIANGVI